MIFSKQERFETRVHIVSLSVCNLHKFFTMYA